jgi:kynureninase
MKTITTAGHKAGAKVGWDLAHAAGNIKIRTSMIECGFCCLQL